MSYAELIKYLADNQFGYISKDFHGKDYLTNDNLAILITNADTPEAETAPTFLLAIMSEDEGISAQSDLKRLTELFKDVPDVDVEQKFWGHPEALLA